MFLPRISRDYNTQAIVSALLDAGFVFLAYAGAVFALLPPGVSVLDFAVAHSGFCAIFLVFWYCESMDRGLWESARTQELGTYLFQMFRGLIGAMMLCVFVIALFARDAVAYEFLAVFFLFSAIALPVLRTVIQMALMALRYRGLNVQSVLIIGANEHTADLAEMLQERPYYGYDIEGFLESDPARVDILERYGLPHLGAFEALPSILAERQIHEVFVSLPVRTCYETIRRVKYVCLDQKVQAHLIADPIPLRIARRQLRHMGDVPLLSLSTIPEAEGALFLKRAMDFALSSIMLVALAPFFIGMAILIKLDSRGPVFFLQERVGKNQRRFKMIKFRSMRTDAEQLRQELEHLNEADGPVFKIRKDPRVTRVGRFIRKFSLDEFPQLINVWLGQMSLVGPRPPLASEVAKYTWDQRRRLSVRPGMTGLWQVSGRSDVAFDQWVEFDLTYIDTWSIWNDLRILFRTFRAVIEGRGAA